MSHVKEEEMQMETRRKKSLCFQAFKVIRKILLGFWICHGVLLSLADDNVSEHFIREGQALQNPGV